MKRIGYLLAVLAICGVAFGLRARAVRQLPVDYDEPIYLRAAQDYSRAVKAGNWGEIIQYDDNLEHPPLMKLVYAGVLRFLPEAEEVPLKPVNAPPPASLPEPIFTASRYTALAFGVLEVLVIALISPLAGLFLAIHTFTIKYTSQVYLEALPAFTSALVVWAYARAIRGEREKEGRVNDPRWGWLVASALALGLTAASKYIYAVVGFAVLLHWVWSLQKDRWLSWKTLSPILIWGGAALVFFFAADPFLWPNPLGRLKESLLYSVEYTQSAHVQGANAPFWQPLVTLFQPVPWHPGVFLLPLDALITFLALMGLPDLGRKKPLYVFWLGTGLVFLFLWPTKWPQYTLILTAPLTVAAAEGVNGIVVKGGKKGWKALLKRFRVRPRAAAPGRQQARFRKWVRVTAWVLPGVLVLGGIALYPMLFQFAMSLTDFAAPAIRDGLTGGVWREVWQGLTGQVDPVEVRLFSSSRAAREVHYAGTTLLRGLFLGAGAEVLAFEIIWTVLAVVLQTALGVGVALVLHRPQVRFKGFWRTLFILPWAIPEFVGGIAWAQTFDPQFGWFNQAAESWFQRPPDIPGVTGFAVQWQDDPSAALLVLLIAGTWYGFPLMMLAASAGLKMLPRDVYEAAEIDGANGWQKFYHLTRPLLLPLLAPAVIIRTIYAFNQFYLFYALNPPWPAATLATVSFFVFGEGGQYATSAAINILTVVVLTVIILAFNRGSSASEGVTYA
jgi:ABC-type sugar transport system permease subunit